MRNRGSRQNLEGWLRSKTAPAPLTPKPARPPRRPRPPRPAPAEAAMMLFAKRRICALCGRAFAIVMPPEGPERERDKLCAECASLPAPPEE